MIAQEDRNLLVCAGCQYIYYLYSLLIDPKDSIFIAASHLLSCGKPRGISLNRGHQYLRGGRSCYYYLVVVETAPRVGSVDHLLHVPTPSPSNSENHTTRQVLTV